MADNGDSIWDLIYSDHESVGPNSPSRTPENRMDLDVLPADQGPQVTQGEIIEYIAPQVLMQPPEETPPLSANSYRPEVDRYLQWLAETKQSLNTPYTLDELIAKAGGLLDVNEKLVLFIETAIDIEHYASAETQDSTQKARLIEGLRKALIDEFNRNSAIDIRAELAKADNKLIDRDIDPVDGFILESQLEYSKGLTKTYANWRARNNMPSLVELALAGEIKQAWLPDAINAFTDAQLMEANGVPYSPLLILSLSNLEAKARLDINTGFRFPLPFFNEVPAVNISNQAAYQEDEQVELTQIPNLNELLKQAKSTDDINEKLTHFFTAINFAEFLNQHRAPPTNSESIRKAIMWIFTDRANVDIATQLASLDSNLIKQRILPYTNSATEFPEWWAVSHTTLEEYSVWRIKAGLHSLTELAQKNELDSASDAEVVDQFIQAYLLNEGKRIPAGLLRGALLNLYHHTNLLGLPPQLILVQEIQAPAPAVDDLQPPPEHPHYIDDNDLVNAYFTWRTAANAARSPQSLQQFIDEAKNAATPRNKLSHFLAAIRGIDYFTQDEQIQVRLRKAIEKNFNDNLDVNMANELSMLDDELIKGNIGPRAEQERGNPGLIETYRRIVGEYAKWRNKNGLAPLSELVLKNTMNLALSNNVIERFTSEHHDSTGNGDNIPLLSMHLALDNFIHHINFRREVVDYSRWRTRNLLGEDVQRLFEAAKATNDVNEKLHGFFDAVRNIELYTPSGEQRVRLRQKIAGLWRNGTKVDVVAQAKARDEELIGKYLIVPEKKMLNVADMREYYRSALIDYSHWRVDNHLPSLTEMAMRGQLHAAFDDNVLQHYPKLHKQGVSKHEKTVNPALFREGAQFLQHNTFAIHSSPDTLRSLDPATPAESESIVINGLSIYPKDALSSLESNDRYINDDAINVQYSEMAATYKASAPANKKQRIHFAFPSHVNQMSQRPAVDTQLAAETTQFLTEDEKKALAGERIVEESFREEIKNTDLVFLPLSDRDLRSGKAPDDEGTHWMALVYDRREKKFHFYDSLGTPEAERKAREMAQHIYSYLEPTNASPIDIKKMFVKHNAPKQTIKDAADCGLHMLGNFGAVLDGYKNNAAFTCGSISNEAHRKHKPTRGNIAKKIETECKTHIKQPWQIPAQNEAIKHAVAVNCNEDGIDWKKIDIKAPPYNVSGKVVLESKDYIWVKPDHFERLEKNGQIKFSYSHQLLHRLGKASDTSGAFAPLNMLPIYCIPKKDHSRPGTSLNIDSLKVGDTIQAKLISEEGRPGSVSITNMIRAPEQESSVKESLLETPEGQTFIRRTAKPGDKLHNPFFSRNDYILFHVDHRRNSRSPSETTSTEKKTVVEVREKDLEGTGLDFKALTAIANKPAEKRTESDHQRSSIKLLNDQQLKAAQDQTRRRTKSPSTPGLGGR